MGFDNFSEYTRQDSTYTTIAKGKQQILAGGGTGGGDIADDSTDLQAIIDAWPTLSDDVKAGILAMVKAAGE